MNLYNNDIKFDSVSCIFSESSCFQKPEMVRYRSSSYSVTTLTSSVLVFYLTPSSFFFLFWCLFVFFRFVSFLKLFAVVDFHFFFCFKDYHQKLKSSIVFLVLNIYFVNFSLDLLLL